MDFTSLRACPVISNGQYTRTAKLDLSITNEELQTYNVSSCTSLSNYINIKSHGTTLLYGGYLEQRDIYSRSGHFKNTSINRDIHLGIDLWAPIDTSIFAVLDGTVHSFANNTGLGNYGPTIVIKHDSEQGIFYTLYGHLNIKSLENLVEGKSIIAGDKIAELGSSKVNGDYPPHLHFQVILDMGQYIGDYPGVCALKDLDFYKAICPDPMGLLRWLK